MTARGRWDRYIGRLPPIARDVLRDSSIAATAVRARDGVRDDQFDHPPSHALLEAAAQKVRRMYPENFKQE